jgi:hypothetical protein
MKKQEMIALNVEVILSFVKGRRGNLFRAQIIPTASLSIPLNLKWSLHRIGVPSVEICFLDFGPLELK